MGSEKVKAGYRLKVVIDTSVFISTTLFRGPTNRLLSLWQKGEICVLMSSDVLREYAKVLAYPKFKLTVEEIKAVIEQELLPFIKPVKIRRAVRVLVEDPADDKFLALGHEGKADYILSGDKHLLDLKVFRSVRIVTPAEFFKLFAPIL